MNSIIDGTEPIDTSKFSYSDPKANPRGGKVVNMYNKEARESLCISTPMMLTWGAQEGKDQEGNPTGKYTMSLQFPTEDYSNDEIDAYLKFMSTLERSVKQTAKEKSKQWFGKEINIDEVIEEKFNVMLRHPRVKGSSETDYGRPPTLTVKLPCWKDIWQSEIYDETGKPLYTKSMASSGLNPLEYLKPKTHVMCILQCGGLWFVNGKVSITWNLKQAVVKKPKETQEGVCLIQLKQEDKEKFENLPEVETETTGNEISLTVVEESDDEGDITTEDVKDGYSVVQKEPEDEEQKEPELNSVEEQEQEEEVVEPEPVVVEKPVKKVAKKKAPVKKK